MRRVAADGNGVKENAIDSAIMFSNNHKLQALVLTYWVSIAFCTLFLMIQSHSFIAVAVTTDWLLRRQLLWLGCREVVVCCAPHTNRCLLHHSRVVC